MAINPNHATECETCGCSERDPETGAPACAVSLDSCLDCGAEIRWASPCGPTSYHRDAPVVCRESRDADQNLCTTCARERAA